MSLSDFAREIAEARYFQNGEDWEQCTHRVSKIHPPIGDAIYNLQFLPGGRIIRNASRGKGSLLNCYVVPIGDSIREIKTYYGDSLELWSEGGGVGTNLSPLRPKGDPILGKGGESSGPVSFLTAGDAVANTIESGGQRRAAAMACMDVSHPSIFDFIRSKDRDGDLSHYNLSVVVNEYFLKAVEKDAMWPLTFRQREYETVPARELWQLILDKMISGGEPGLLNGSNLLKNNSFYYAPVIATNPCGEVPLEAYGACCLGSIVLPKFLTAKQTKWQEMESVIDCAVEFLDNVLDRNNYILPQNEQAVFRSRRIGLGVMGLAEYLFNKQLAYGSPEAVQETEKLMKFIRDASYTASIRLAREKGSFPAYSPEYNQASFVRKLPARIRMDIKQYGIRNVTVNAVAPTGTISLLADVTSSIEPVFALEYDRKDRVSTRRYRHPILAKIKEGEAWPQYIITAQDILPEFHFEMQAAVQKYVDGAVSKTINLHKDATAEELSGMLLEYAYDLKGVTVYRDGSREGQVLSLDCASGQCDI